MLADTYLTFVPDFRGEQTILLLCDDKTISWLAQKFREHRVFVIGDGKPVDSDGRCIVAVNPVEEGECVRIARESAGLFEMFVPLNAREQICEQLAAMLVSSDPCHQYLEMEGGFIFVISRGEYDIQSFRETRKAD